MTQKNEEIRRAHRAGLSAKYAAAQRWHQMRAAELERRRARKRGRRATAAGRTHPARAETPHGSRPAAGG